MRVAVVLSALIAISSAAQLSGREVVPILSQELDVNFDGSYRSSYETGNGISVQEQGQPKSADTEQVQGSFQYTSPDGTPVALQYTADENGFQPVGSHLPVAPAPPPIPVAIQRSLEWNAAHPEEEREEPGPQRRF